MSAVRIRTWGVGLGAFALTLATVNAGIDAGGKSVGVLSQSSQTVVNGVAYDTSQTQVYIDGVPATAAELAPGQPVEVTSAGEVSDGLAVADAIKVDDSVQGDILGIDAGGRTMRVLGQNVKYDENTVFAGGLSPDMPAESLVGTAVEVSGLPDSEGTILATLIRPAPSAHLEVTGVVHSLNDVFRTFAITDLVVDYSGASLSEFGALSLADDQWVEVRGLALGSSGELLATTVISKEGGGGPPGAEASLEGLITKFVSPAEFLVGATPVRTSQQTEYLAGEHSDLAVNARVVITGFFDADGGVLASRVDFMDGVNDTHGDGN